LVPLAIVCTGDDLDIIVYCGGKCGSSTLHSTFKSNGYKSYQIHDNNYFKFLCNTFKKDNNKTIFDVIDFNVKQSKNIYINTCFGQKHVNNNKPKLLAYYNVFCYLDQKCVSKIYQIMINK
jgi:hypothetical protein